jgi:hypothetical protein
MWITIPYLVAVLACLYGPFMGDLWVGTKSQILFNAGIPLALVTAAQIAVHERLSRAPRWKAVLSLSWMAGCALFCVPSAWPNDLVKQALTVGGLLSVAALGVALATSLGVLRDASLHWGVRVPYGLALLGVGAVLLRGGVRVMNSADGGPLAGSIEGVELFRRAVSGLSGPIILAGLIEWGIARRRRTSGCS